MTAATETVAETVVAASFIPAVPTLDMTQHAIRSPELHLLYLHPERVCVKVDPNERHVGSGQDLLGFMGRPRATTAPAHATFCKGPSRARALSLSHSLSLSLFLSLFPSLPISLSLSPFLAASMARLVESCSWTRKALSSILASATIAWVAEKSSLQSLWRNLKPKIPQVFRTSAAPVQE